MCWSSQQLTEKDEVRHILGIFCSICQYRIDTLLNINCERRTLRTAASAHLPLWLPSSYVDFCFFFPFGYFSWHFLPHFASFLHCVAFPHFLSLSASSRCLIHQHLLKLCVVLCIKCVMPHECFCICRKVGRKCARLCESGSLLACFLAKWKREAKQLTFGTLLWPHTSGKKGAWLTELKVSRQREPQRQRRHSSQMCCPRACKNLTDQVRFLTSRQTGKGLTWKNEKLNSRITTLPFNLPCYP